MMTERFDDGPKMEVKSQQKSWSRPLCFVAVVVVVTLLSIRPHIMQHASVHIRQTISTEHRRTTAVKTSSGLLDDKQPRLAHPEIERIFRHEIFSILSNISRGNYEAKVLGAGWDSRHGFVCLNPHAKIYGGFGNVMRGIIGVLFYSVATDKVAVANHPLVAAIFQHPAITTSDNITLTPISVSHVAHIKSRVHAVKCEHGLPRQASIIGFHGVPCLSEGYKLLDGMLSSIVRQQLSDEAQKLLQDDAYGRYLLCQGAAAWSMSRITTTAQIALDSFKQSLLHQCLASDNIPDLVVQVRATDDGNVQSSAVDCVITCAQQRLQHLQQTLQRPACVFVTSNTESSRVYVEQQLNGSSVQFLSDGDELVHHPGRHASHTGGLIETTRWHDHFHAPLGNMTDLMEWLLIGEATLAVASSSSTFLDTARLRLPETAPLRHIFDPLQYDTLAEVVADGTSRQCTCRLITKKCV